MKIIGIIPARFASTRFPGKPLILINGKSMIQRVYEQSKRAASLSEVVVATDDDTIYNHVIGFGGKVVLTSANHQTGTDRCAEIIGLPEFRDYDVAINIQGDEPYIHPEQINQVADCFTGNNVQIATLVKKLEKEDELFSPTVMKVVFTKERKALYFSRTPIPFQRGKEQKEWLNNYTYHKHIGIYAFRTSILSTLSTLPQSGLELAESLEQLRWLENGFDIYVNITEFESHSVDVPEDLLKFNNL